MDLSGYFYFSSLLILVPVEAPRQRQQPLHWLTVAAAARCLTRG
jgi:hypothetical protein